MEKGTQTRDGRAFEGVRRKMKPETGWGMELGTRRGTGTMDEIGDGMIRDGMEWDGKGREIGWIRLGLDGMG